MLSQLKTLLPPGAKQLINRLRGNPVQVSTDYKPLSDSREILRLRDAWQDPSLPAEQRRLADRQLAEMRAGRPPRVFEALAEAVRDTGDSHGQIVEIGCSSGYYSEALAFLLGHAVDYTGMDYSASFIEMARQRYPGLAFEVADAVNLPLLSQSCDILISGCVLLHVPDYKKAIFESVRVSRRWIIFHRTPITEEATRLFEKRAYGVRCLELRFNERALLTEFEDANLSVVQEYMIEEKVKTYLCRRKENSAP